MVFDFELFCKNLKTLRESKGLNKYEMSIQANISHSYYTSIENGHKIPNFKTVILIANAIHTDISHLLKNENTGVKEAIMDEIVFMLNSSNEEMQTKHYKNLIAYKKRWSK